ncbi:Outer membrane receptor proteins, mostly Fe transport [Chitinophaga costaii]|uniref:Outer membrane receptor proteins, mostly Fe transport n=1 Tax=Chitinophaga costaii TaxID=1335309 RepID=A0A1C4G5M4_9BACT|nr:outer membrane beta-barrel family protein [Chitinophaga costaii]SCC63470.1 Outer membrane receptor proteins, mostly Fe transport [Chitinophaga costaii]
MRKNVLLLLLLLVVASNVAIAQQHNQASLEQQVTGHLQGKLLDAKTGAPVEMASIAILRADSTLVTGMYSNAEGGFLFNNIPLGKTLLRINFVGYKTLFKPVVLTKAAAMVDLGDVKLESNVKSLAAVTVIAERPTFTMAIDKRVFNVDKNLASVGGTATDVLKQVPSVNVDIDGNVTVRNGAPTIMVDGRPTTLTLDQIPADAIQSIEVVTNPSAKYDAEGMSGILNIILKKDKKNGTNGQVRGGFSTLGSYNAGLDFSMRRKKINWFVNYNVRDRKGSSRDEIKRTTTGPDSLSYLNQNNDGNIKRLFQYARTGVDWFMDDRNTLSLSGSLVKGDFKNKNNQALTEFDSLHTPLRYGSGINNSQNGFTNYTAELNYKRTFIKEGEELSANVQYNRANSSDHSQYNLFYNNPDGTPSYDPHLPEVRHGDGTGNTTYFTGQVDYVNPFSTRSKLEAGLRSTARVFNNKLYTMGLDPVTSTYGIDTALSNDYHYTENINAAYVSYTGGTRGNFGYQAGLRAEQSSYDGRLNTLKTGTYKLNYPISLFPSVFLTQKLKDDNEFQLNYSRRIRRPWFLDLVPNLSYGGQSASRGNPLLKPEFTNAFEFSYLKDFSGKANVLVSLYYRNTTNAITTFYQDTTLNINGADQHVLLSYPINANNRNSFGAEFTLRNQITKGWDITTNANLSHTQIDASNQGSNLNNSGITWFGKVNSNTKLPWNLTLQVTGNYNSKEIQPQGERMPNYTADLGLKKDFLKNNAASISLGLNDVFNTNRDLSYTYTEYQDQERYRKQASRELRLNFSWRFGKMESSDKKEKEKKNKDNHNDDNGGINGDGN